MRYLSPRNLSHFLANDFPWLRRAWQRLRPPRDQVETASDWDDGYANGRWDYQAQSEEDGRHALVAAFYGRFRGEGDVLEVGCGPGNTQPHLAAYGYSSYLGCDFSGVAIEAAQARADARTAFVVAAAETFEPGRRFDAILLVESAHFFRDPPAQLRRYAAMLKPGGVLVVSLFTIGLRTLGLWAAFEQDFEVIEESAVINRRGRMSTVKVLRARTPAAAPEPRSRLAGIAVPLLDGMGYAPALL